VSFNWRRVQLTVGVIVGALTVVAPSMFTGAMSPLLTLLGLSSMCVFAVRLMALPGQGHNPRPQSGLGATAQARSYELELVEQDEESQIRCVVMEFMHRPLSEESIATLESDIWLAMQRADEEFSNTLAGGRQPVHIFPAHPIDVSVETPIVGGLRPVKFEDVPAYNERGERITVEDMLPKPLSPEERPDSPWDDPLYLGRKVPSPKWSCKRDGHVFEEGNCRCVMCKVHYNER
jgi:hypothetical protein